MNDINGNLLFVIGILLIGAILWAAAASDIRRRRRLHSDRVPASSVPSGRQEVRPYSGQRYVLKCRDCSFTHPIPDYVVDGQMTFSVERETAKLKCVYGYFTVSLAVGEFFTLDVDSSPASVRIVRAEIVGNMKVLHPHMLSHCDPLFLYVRQTQTSTAHEYKRRVQGDPDVPYVLYTRNGADFSRCGEVNVEKAEIPGISWNVG